MNMNRAINMIFIRPLVAFALAALLVFAACLSIAAPALAQEGAKWHMTCDSDGWDDVVCAATSYGVSSRKQSEIHSQAVYRCAKRADGTKEGFYQLEFAPSRGDALSLGSESAETDSEGRTFYNVPMRWDDEPPSTTAFWFRKPSNDSFFEWALVWKNQSQAARQLWARDKLRIRPNMGFQYHDPLEGVKYHYAPTTFTYSLLGAAEAIGEAARKCGF